MPQRQDDYPEHLREATETIEELRHGRRDELPRDERLITHAMRRVGPRTIFGLAAFIVIWVVLNLVLRAQHRNFDDGTFSLLDTIAQLSSLVIAICILSSQNTMGRLDDERTRLTLQISLIVDRKVTQILTELDDLRGSPKRSEEAEALREPTDLHKAAEALREADSKISERH